MKPYLMMILLTIICFTTSCELTLEVGMEHSQNATPNPSSTAFFTPTPSLQPSQTPSPTPIPPTPSPTVTNTPVGQIFRDDFSGFLQEGWTWTNEDPSRWIITEDGWLQITGQDASLQQSNGINLLCRPAPTGDYQVTTHVFTEPWADFMAAALILLQDADDYININRGFCGPCLPGGGGVYMEYMMSGSLGVAKTAANDPDMYLRLVKEGSSVSAYYALDDGNWQFLGTVGNFLRSPRVCLAVFNNDYTGSVNFDLTGKFDYVEISQP